LLITRREGEKLDIPSGYMKRRANGAEICVVQNMHIAKGDMPFRPTPRGAGASQHGMMISEDAVVEYGLTSSSDEFRIDGNSIAKN
jgi:hypothetical protein